METKKQILTQYELVPNPAIIRFNTNWDIRLHPSLEFITNSLEGVEPIDFWGLSRYSFSIEIGAIFDRDTVAKSIIEKINEYFEG